MSTPHARHADQRGLTLIEAMMVLAVVSIAIGSALPGLSSMRQRADLAGAAAQVETDVQFARSEAVASNRTVRLTLRESGDGTCYMVHTGPAADCTCSGRPSIQASCSGDAELLRAVSFTTQGPVQVRSASKSLTFDPSKGTVTPTATLRVEGTDGRALHQVINLLGRVRTCSPNGRVVDERAC
jgi:type IV fimbrial biogenesis protein FimT